MDETVVDRELGAPLQRLVAGFPDLPRDVISSILSDSYVKVVEASGMPQVDRAEELAQLRLEVRTRHPMRL